MDVFLDSGQDGFELTASFSIILQFACNVNTILRSFSLFSTLNYTGVLVYNIPVWSNAVYFVNYCIGEITCTKMNTER